MGVSMQNVAFNVPRSRTEALVKDEKLYFSGLCKYGHLSVRVTSTGRCRDCSQKSSEKWAAANPGIAMERAAKWYVQNPDRARSTRSKYREVNRETLLAGKKKYYEENRGHCIALTTANRRNNVGRYHIYERASYVNNKEKRLAYGKAHRENFPEKNAAKSNRYRAAKLRLTPSWADEEAIKAVYLLARQRRDAGEDVHVDHVIPLKGRRVSGLHVENNLRVVSARENLSKRNKLIEELL